MRYRLQISLEHTNNEILSVVMGNWLKWIEKAILLFYLEGVWEFAFV